MDVNVSTVPYVAIIIFYFPEAYGGSRFEDIALWNVGVVKSQICPFSYRSTSFVEKSLVGTQSNLLSSVRIVA